MQDPQATEKISKCILFLKEAIHFRNYIAGTKNMSSSSKFIQIHRYIRYKTQTQNLIIYFFATKKEISPKKTSNNI